MYLQRSDNRFVHSALFADLQTAQAALYAIQVAGLSNDQLALAVHSDERVPEKPRSRQNDGKRGLLIGLGSGALVGLVSCLLLSRFGVLSGLFEQSALFGLFVGMLFGGLGGGLYGTGLTTPTPRELESVHRKPNCLVTAKTANVNTILQVEGIFRKHHGLAGAG